jgi:hypothetical protein
MLNNGHGSLQLAMVGGDLSAVLVDLSGLEFGNALLSALGMPQRAKAECFITEAALNRGDFRLQALVLDTSEAIITGTGGVNLRDELLYIQLRTEAKLFSIGSLPAPINIGGTLKNPAISRAGTRTAGGAASGLGFIFPLLAALPTIQFGTGEEHRCDQILARAKQQISGQRLLRQGPSGK